MNHRPEYFFMIEKEGSITKAAEKLYLSQPYLSQYLAKIEEELGAKLFDRSSQPLKLTEAGILYRNYLENLMYLEVKFEVDLYNILNASEKVIKIGIAIWRGSILLPDILPIFLHKFPNINILLFEKPVSELFELLDEKQIDLAIMHGVDTGNKYVKDTILNEKILLVANKNNKHVKGNESFLDNLKPFDIRTIKHERFILLGEEQTLFKLVNNLFNKYQIVPHNKIVTTNLTTALNLVAANVGFTFVPETGARYTANIDNLYFYTIDDPVLSAPLCLIYNKSTFLSPAIKEFIDITKSYYKKLTTNK